MLSYSLSKLEFNKIKSLKLKEAISSKLVYCWDEWNDVGAWCSYSAGASFAESSAGRFALMRCFYHLWWTVFITFGGLSRLVLSLTLLGSCLGSFLNFICACAASFWSNCGTQGHQHKQIYSIIWMKGISIPKSKFVPVNSELLFQDLTQEQKLAHMRAVARSNRQWPGRG